MDESALKHTPLIEEHRRLAARLIDFSGWVMPIQYTSISVEHQAVRRAIGIFDVSHMGEFFVTGNGAVDCVNQLITNDLERLADGRALYTCACNAQGGVLDDLIVYRLQADEVMIVCNASNQPKMREHFRQHCDQYTAAAAASSLPIRVQFDDGSDHVCLLAVQGPRALDLIAKVGLEIGHPAEVLRPFDVARSRLAGAVCTVARTGYTGEDGVEVFCQPQDAVGLWRHLLEVGRDMGVQPVGLAARDTLRLEARLSLYGNEIDETTHPFEAGLGWTVKLDKRNFLGKSALTEIHRQPPKRRLVGFNMVERGIARHGYPLLDLEGEPVGICTSGSPSPTLGKNIGLGYLPAGLAGLGTGFLVDCRGRRVRAQVVDTPFYKRPRAS